MKAIQLVRRRIEYSDDRFSEIVIWKLDRPALGSNHIYKYRLAYMVNEECILRYDNETGKGDHRHFGGREFKYNFRTIDDLLFDFQREVRSMNDENSSS